MQLKKYLKMNQIPQYKFASIFGVSPSTIYMWCSGKKFPTVKNMAKIFEITKGKVGLQDWNELRKKMKKKIPIQRKPYNRMIEKCLEKKANFFKNLETQGRNE